MNKRIGRGRTPHASLTYNLWLQDMRPFLKCGFSLHQAIQKAGLNKHKDSIYRKFRLGGEFCEKIRKYQRYPGEVANSIFARLIMKINDKVKSGEELNRIDYRILCWFATHHRSATPFFIHHRERVLKKYDAFGDLVSPTNQTIPKPPKIEYIASSHHEFNEKNKYPL